MKSLCTRYALRFAALTTALVGMSPSSCRAAADLGGQSPGAEPAMALARVVQDYHARNKFDGVVLVAKGGRVLYQGGVGLADRTSGNPNRVATSYPICSITKQFTAVLVMRQVEQGKISLTSTLDRYLPEFRGDTARKITVENLLTHTSGLRNADAFLPPSPDADAIPGFYLESDPAKYQAKYVIAHYLNADLSAVPGTKFDYNNADYLVLAEILRRVTGKDYATLLRDDVTRPLGMSHTGLYGSSPGAPALARGYVGDTALPEPPVNLATFGAAGAMFSTAGDLLRWNDALLRHKLLGEEAQKRIFTPVAGLGYEGLSTWVYHAGFSDSPAKPLLYERDGAIDAFQTLNILSPDDGSLSVIVLSNRDTSDLGHVYTRSGLAYDLLHCVYARPSQ